MRIHTDKLSALDIYAAANFSAAVRVAEVTEHGSRTRERAFRFYLLGSSSFRPNQRDYDPDDYAATWDEWGIVIGHLFSQDPAAHFGRHSYRSAEDFHYKTGHRFVPGFITPDMQHKRHKWEPDYARSFYCDCGAVQRLDAIDYRPIEPAVAA